jgi:murein DD-endopeptidase MepM/ murein hydrolase activator NlpD
MPQIDIEIERPWLTLALVGGAIAYFVMRGSPATQASPMGGDPDSVAPASTAQTVHDAEVTAEHQREKQQALSRREDILRSELAILEAEIQNGGDAETMQQLSDARANLVSLIQDKQAAESAIADSLQQIWDAEGIAMKASANAATPEAVVHFMWPVAPLDGISAHFNDPLYLAKFGVPHHAVDIPTPQGSIVGAAADGVVETVSDKGMGFNSLVIRHANGMTTLYGHVIKFLVTEGQTVHAGQPVALSGGTPGTPGAGPMTTGAHLHIAFYKDGQAVDPMLYLPHYPGIE